MPCAASRVRLCGIVAWLASLVIALTHTTHHPSHRWPEPAWWLKQAACIRWYESRNDWHANTGNGYYGAYQFLASTWYSVGGRGLPSEASPREQTFRAWRVWRRDGGSWREWGTASDCGLT